MFAFLALVTEEPRHSLQVSAVACSIQSAVQCNSTGVESKERGLKGRLVTV